MPELSSNLHHLTKPAYHTAPFPTLKNLNLIQLLASICILILSVIVLEENITSYIGNRILYDFGVHTAFGIPVRSALSCVAANMLTSYEMPWKHALPAFSEHDPFYYLRFPHWKFARSFSFVAFFGAIGIISAGHALLLAIRMFLARGRKVNGRASALAKFGLYTTALSFILSFVAVIYGWHGAGTTFTTEEVRNNSYNDTSGSHGYSGPLVMWRATTGPVAALDDFTWNCALVAPVWNGLESISNEFLPAVYMDFWCHKSK